MAKEIKNNPGVLYLFFLFIFALGLFLRFFGVLSGGFALTYDVGRDFLQIHKQVFGHDLSLIGPTSGQGGIFYGPWWYWLMALPFLLVGGSPTGMVLTIAVTGLVAILASFWWGRKYFNDVFGLVIAGVLSFASYFIGVTNQFWNPNLLIIVTLLVLMLLYSVTKLNKKLLFVFGFLCTLAIELQLFCGTFLFLGILLCLLIFQRKLFFSQKILVFLSGTFFVELPRLVFEKKNDFLQTKVFLKTLSENATQHYDISLRAKILTEYWSSVWPTNFLPVVVFLSLILIILFIYQTKKEKNKERKVFYKEIILLITMYSVTTIFYKKDFWNYYLTGLPVILLIPLAVVVSSWLSKFKTKGLWLAFIFILLFLRPLDIWRGITGPKFVGDASVYRNQIEVVDYLYREAKGKEFNVTIYTPPIYSYTWDYLFLWYGNKKYHSLPATKATATLFMVIEPDPGYEGRITNWLKVREGDGRIIGEKTFPSGIIVQSRFRSL